MATWYLRVLDAGTSQPIEGAAVTATISTSCCPNCYGSCSCGSCTSGNGYQNVGNTDSTGNVAFVFSYTTKQSLDVLVTANGYNDTHVNYNTGFITGDVRFPDVQLTELTNVPQTNQGSQGDAAYGGNTASRAAGDAAAAVSPPSGPFGSIEEVVIIIAVAIIAIVLLVFFVMLKK